ncbi:hypothetical protein VCUG_02848 [Vavraia culicis subsp. floridensis]|uniref:Uncharacterized protein n=1 Tax=Vavraia culicis (isolate floridensis) TaxID=948595 RepID=A0A024RE56_VAVCU|nr:uncharacterized protein VCUG_02848 [Vavraia culicis subsp. floridensis]ETA55730.1 hypothetical protein VCUG_02848 [Vavraia culicis subsp. floridensis]
MHFYVVYAFMTVHKRSPVIGDPCHRQKAPFYKAIYVIQNKFNDTKSGLYEYEMLNGCAFFIGSEQYVTSDTNFI